MRKIRTANWRMYSLISLTVLMVFCLAACGGDSDDNWKKESEAFVERVNDIGLEELATMTRDEVVAALGMPLDPDYSDARCIQYKRNDDNKGHYLEFFYNVPEEQFLSNDGQNELPRMLRYLRNPEFQFQCKLPILDLTVDLESDKTPQKQLARQLDGYDCTIFWCEAMENDPLNRSDRDEKFVRIYMDDWIYDATYLENRNAFDDIMISYVGENALWDSEKRQFYTRWDIEGLPSEAEPEEKPESAPSKDTEADVPHDDIPATGAPADEGVLMEYFYDHLDEFECGMFKDLTHDGTEELLLITSNGVENTLTVYTEKNGSVEKLWSAMVGSYTAVYGYIYLYEKDGLAYILCWGDQYDPNDQPWYRLLYLDANGKEIVTAQASGYDGYEAEEVYAGLNALMKDATMLCTPDEYRK